jgi:Trk K+ transport system NAD-binding subunit
MDQPVILCGLGTVGRRVLDNLHAAGVPVVVIDDHCSPDQLRLDKVRLIQGDFRTSEVLLQADLEKARGVLILTSDDLVNISTALMVRHLHARVRIVVRLFNQNLVPRLGKAVTNTYALSVSSLTAPLLALTAMTGQALGTFSTQEGRKQIAELTVQEGSALKDQSIGSVGSRHEVFILGHFPKQGDKRFLLDVDAEARLAAGDQLVVCGDPHAIGPLLEEMEEDLLPHLRWAGWMRRVGRMAWRTVMEIDKPVLLCTAILLSVVTLSTLVYHLGVGKHLPDSLYRTISVIATGADMRETELPEGWQKIFVSALRIMGAALIAAFTAIVTNYLLRARLRGAFEVRRIPDSGHIIVCGLGNVGFRLVEELERYGERVVIIDAQRDGQFMAAARRRDVAIIIGDATVTEVLRQAHAATARAVVAATNNELVNLEIALLARDLNPHQRVVVRLSDIPLAETLRDAANIRFAVALPALAAPAFLAALFGDRVLSVFLAHGRYMAVIELVVQSTDSWLDGQVVRAVAIDYQLLPVALVRQNGPAARQSIMNYRLGPGDQLTVITALKDMARMLRRERIPTDWGVLVTGCNLPGQPVVLEILRERQKLSPEEAESALNRLPVWVGKDLTRGQAEDLLYDLAREGVKAQVQKMTA